jgi:nitrite reductase (NO-forming)
MTASPRVTVRMRPWIAALMAAVLSVATVGAVSAQERASVIPDLVPKAELPAAPADEVNVSYAPAVPPASGRTEPAVVEVEFEVVEQVTQIDPATGVEYETWGYRVLGDDDSFSGTPGPMIRARVGDLLRFTIHNPEGNSMPHNVDFHAVTGQGGGAESTVVGPGGTATIEARLLYPGLFMYHCAMGDVPEHIVRGMYGGILVDPAEPLPPVEHEWYIVQSEFYTTSTEPGVVETDRAAVTDEHPTMVVFNGAKGSLTGDNAPRMQVGERARIYFVNAGLNLISSFHPIGSHWDVVYPEAALLAEPLRGSQTTLVPAGGGTVVELVGQVPSAIILVDHALARTFDKGALGQIIIEGEPDTEIFEAIAVE